MRPHSPGEKALTWNSQTFLNPLPAALHSTSSLLYHPAHLIQLLHTRLLSRMGARMAVSSERDLFGFIMSVYGKAELRLWNLVITNIRQFTTKTCNSCRVKKREGGRKGERRMIKASRGHPFLQLLHAHMRSKNHQGSRQYGLNLPICLIHSGFGLTLKRGCTLACAVK